MTSLDTGSDRVARASVACDPPAIPYVQTDALEPEVLALYRKIEAAVGFVPNSMMTYLHKPAIAAVLLEMATVLYAVDNDSLPRTLTAKLGLICSAVNGCAYCTSHQCSTLQASGSLGAVTHDLAQNLSDDDLARLISGQDDGGTAVERASFAFARAASFDPAAVPRDMLSNLRGLLTPGQIVQLAGIVGMWKLFNTIHDSLHLPIEPDRQRYGGVLERSAR